MAAGQNRLKLLLKIDTSLNNNHPMENYIRDQFGLSCSNIMRKDGSVWEELSLLFCPHDDKGGLRHAGFAV